MKMSKAVRWLFVFSALAGAFPLPAAADHDDHDDRGGGWHGGGWHGDIRHFNDRDLSRWRTGHWHHSYHDGQLGWWWVVAGLWYLYPQRVADYPDPYLPPPVAAIQQSAPAPSAPPPAQYWYYCGAAKGYYPYVPSCPTGWRMVPATPSDVPAQ